MLSKVRAAIDGKKVYLVAVAGIIGAALAWSSGELTNMQAAAAVWASLMAGGFRSALDKFGLGGAVE